MRIAKPKTFWGTETLASLNNDYVKFITSSLDYYLQQEYRQHVSKGVYHTAPIPRSLTDFQYLVSML